MSSEVGIEVVVVCAAWRAALADAATLAEDAARAAIDRAGQEFAAQAELDILLADDAQVRALNRTWRGRDAPTNVLSFATDEPAHDDRPQLLGDVVLAFETVAREAQEQGKPLADHLRHLIVHGVLHLLGWDHEVPAEAERMEALERRILVGLGVPDPYREAEQACG